MTDHNQAEDVLLDGQLTALAAERNADSVLALLVKRPLRLPSAIAQCISESRRLPHIPHGRLVLAANGSQPCELTRYPHADRLVHVLAGRLVVRREGSVAERYEDELLGQGESLVLRRGEWHALLSVSASTPGLAWTHLYGREVGSESRTVASWSPVLVPDYYWGYDERYRTVYEAGAETWETRAPNEAVEHLVREGTLAVGCVLDLGCGEGRDSIFLAKHGFTVVGVDVSPAALSVARSLAEQARVRCDFLERDVVYLRNLPRPRFDAALNMGCLHMMPDAFSRTSHLRRVHEVLEPDGLFLVAHCRERWGEGFASVPNYAELGRLLPGQVTPRRVVTKDGERLLSLRELPYRESSDDELADELERAGFVVEKRLSHETYAFGSTVVLLCRKNAGQL